MWRLPSLVALVLLSFLATAFIPPATAAIYRWDNGELITEKDAEPGADLSGMDLGYADLHGASLSHARFRESSLSNAHLTDADLTGVVFGGAGGVFGDPATLTNADFSGAVIRGANFLNTTRHGFTAEQFYSTASYQEGDISGVNLSWNDLTDWDFTGIDVRGAWFFLTTSRGFTAEQLYSTASYQSSDLTGIGLADNDLTGWNFAGKNLTDASLDSYPYMEGEHYTTLHDADFTETVVRGVDFSWATDFGFTAEQLYSTASFKTGDLAELDLSDNDLTGWDLAVKNLRDVDFNAATLTDADLSGANLTDARFRGATLTDADLSLSDLRGAEIEANQIASAASRKATILPDGRIGGVVLAVSERLVIHDDNGYTPIVSWKDPRDPIPITIESTMTIDPTATLQMVFEDDNWASTISFEPGIDVALDGTLELTFANGTRPADLIGTTFDLFDWDGVTPIGAFAEVVSDANAEWDTSNVYTTGEVILLSAEILLADVNLDGKLNGLDVDPFVEVLLHGPHWPEADMNSDGEVNGLDVNPFVAAVVGGTQQIPEPSTLLLCILALSITGALRKWGVWEA